MKKAEEFVKTGFSKCSKMYYMNDIIGCVNKWYYCYKNCVNS